ncbi:MAG: hypothetical protein IJ127_26580 [Afipia sp.]|uniref:hypothetical protein n=1 Tax=unclassified Afipia TaxID=2642050 RepID=UPI0004BAFFEA|nr:MULTISPECIES: hypothetical protein [unclassified Afipia]MBQ8106425.1 hypothetical protein [Afipia sp.]MBS4002684.1 hypothetical protein [Afipia sp.]MDI1263928.1 hypothetical protein [bacterium]
MADGAPVLRLDLNAAFFNDPDDRGYPSRLRTGHVRLRAVATFLNRPGRLSHASSMESTTQFRTPALLARCS